MVASAELPSAETAVTRWLVTCGPDATRAVPLRDYFLRLGIPARLVSPLEIELQTTAAAAELDEYVQSWTAINGLQLELREARPAVPVTPRLDGTLFRPPRLGEILRQRNLVDDEQLESALARAQETGQLLGLVLIESGALFEEDLARTLADQLELPYISIGRVGVSPTTAGLLPSSVGRELAAIPVRPKGDGVLVAFADPTDPDTLAAVHRYLPRFEVGIAELSEILDAWRVIEQARGPASTGLLAA